MAVEGSAKPRAEKEGPGVLTEYGVTLLRWWGKAVVENDGEEAVYAGHGVLSTKVKDGVVFERLSKDE